MSNERKAGAGLAEAHGSGDGLQLWRADETEIKLVGCPNGGWPNNDSDGEKIFENTHFKTPDAAWDKVQREIEARIELTLSAINETEKRMEKLKDELVTSSLLGLKAKENRQAWNRQNDQAHPTAAGGDGGAQKGKTK